MCMHACVCKKDEAHLPDKNTDLDLLSQSLYKTHFGQYQATHVEKFWVVLDIVLIVLIVANVINTSLVPRPPPF